MIKQILDLADQLIAETHELDTKEGLVAAGSITTLATCIFSYYYTSCLLLCGGSCLFSAYHYQKRDDINLGRTIRAISALLTKGTDHKDLPLYSEVQQQTVYDSCFIYHPDQTTQVIAIIGSLAKSCTEGVAFLMPSQTSSVEVKYFEGRSVIVGHYENDTHYYRLHELILSKAKEQRMESLSIALQDWIPEASTKIIFETIRKEEFRGQFKKIHLIYAPWSRLNLVGNLFMEAEAQYSYEDPDDD